MQIALSTYLKPLHELDTVRPAHLEFLKKLISQNKVLFAGRQNPATGGVIVANLASADEFKQILAQDPFTLAGIAEYRIIEFNPVVFNALFEEFCS